ncbi:MAG: hypothetical protein JNM63_00585 [Spirochaetia bacterium]|nr:hypothetical protein [Spirochaetia bacterium]
MVFSPLRSAKSIFLTAGLLVGALWSAPSGGLEIGTGLFFPPQGVFTSPALGGNFRERFSIEGSKIRLGFNLGAEVYLPMPVSNQTFSVLIALPWQGNIFIDLAPKEGAWVFRPGLGLGPYISIKAGKFNTATGGVLPWIQPQVELGFKTPSGLEFLLIPAYSAYFDFLNPGGLYVHGLSLRLAIQFAPLEK